METRIGDWYLCEGYIEEPVRVEALEADRVQVRYLTTGRIRRSNSIGRKESSCCMPARAAANRSGST